jgi:hypothetical protein
LHASSTLLDSSTSLARSLASETRKSGAVFMSDGNGGSAARVLAADLTLAAGIVNISARVMDKERNIQTMNRSSRKSEELIDVVMSSFRCDHLVTSRV